MLKINTVQTNFSSGELSPWLLGRSDIDRYQQGAEMLENFYVRHQGGISRRLGTKNVGRTSEQAANSNVRIIPFEFSRTDAVLIEASAGLFRFFRDGVKIGAPYEVTTIYGTSTTIPYTSDQVNELQFSQSADVLFITHPSHPQATLSRYSDSDWRYEIPEFDYGPYLDQEIGDQNISLTVSDVVDRVTLTSSAADFGSAAVDDLVEYAYSGQKVLGLIKAIFSSTSIEVEPLEDRSLVLSKEVYSPGLYTGWDSTNNVPTYNTTITGTGVEVAFSAVGVVTQQHIGNYVRFADKSGTYYWMSVSAVGDIVRQGAYGITATGDILTVIQPSGIVTRSDRDINAKLTSSDSNFFNLSTDGGRLFRLVLGEYVVHARARGNVTQVCDMESGNQNIGVTTLEGISVGDTVQAATGLAECVVEYMAYSGPDPYIHVSAVPSVTNAAITLTIGNNTTQHMRCKLNRSVPRSIEGFTTVQNGTTNDWNRGAWFTGNYPQTVSFHEGRLAFGGTTLQPQTGWLSRVDDLYNFGTTDEKLRVLDDCAITFTIASETLNEILWMSSKDVLVIGTVGAEWKVASSNQGAPLTPTTISVKAQSSYGNAFTKPITVGKGLIFLQRAGRKLRQMTYDFQTDSNVSLDLTVFAEHVLKDHSGGSSLSYQQLPESAVYVLLNDGQIACMTYEPDQQVYAWSRIVLGGPSAVVESIACVPEDDKYRLYMVVSRTINSTNVRTIEVLEPEFRPSSATDRTEMYFMDNYKSGGGHFPVFSGLDDYKGCTVSVLLDDVVYHDQVVSNTGTLTMPVEAVSRYAIGFPYTSVLKTFPIESQAQAGTGQGKQKRIDHITLRLLDSINFKHGGSLSELKEEDFREASDPTNAVPPMFSGDKRIAYENGSDTRGSYYITQDKSYPLSILSLMPEVTQFK